MNIKNAILLRGIMADNKLKAPDVAELIDVSLDTVRAWLVHEGAARHRPMKNRDIDYLRCKLAARKKANKKPL